MKQIIIDILKHFKNVETPEKTGGNRNLFRKDSEVLQEIAVKLQKLETRVDELDKKNISLNEKIVRLEKHIDENNVQSKIDELDTPPIQNQNIDLDVDQSKESSEWVYFGPAESGLFKKSSQKNIDDSNICFRVNTKSHSIEFIHSNSDSRWLSYRNEYLLPVCDIVNNVVSASSIKMEKSGKVIKQGEDYVIDPKNKIKIKLI